MGYPLEEMKADGGPAQNAYLMQFQSDMAGIKVSLPPVQELSGMGAAFLAGISWRAVSGGNYFWKNSV